MNESKVKQILSAISELVGNQAEQLERQSGLKSLTLVVQFDRDGKPRTGLLRTEIRQQLTLRAVSRL